MFLPNRRWTRTLRLYVLAALAVGAGATLAQNEAAPPQAQPQAQQQAQQQTQRFYRDKDMKTQNVQLLVHDYENERRWMPMMIH